MAKEGEKRISRVAVGSERKKNLTRPLRSKHPETPKRLTKSIILSLSIGGVDSRYRRTILSTCLYVDSVAPFSIFTPAHTQKRTFPHHARRSINAITLFFIFTQSRNKKGPFTQSRAPMGPPKRLFKFHDKNSSSSY